MRANRKQIDPAKIDAYRSTFNKHVHLLVWQGYSRLNRQQLQSMHEPAITGSICEQIEHILDDPKSPQWVDDYEIHDDPPVHAPSRQGRNRRRVDLKLASRRYRPRARFCFEAKCLNKTTGVADYLGPDGLGQFISGGYAANDSHAGMLGYVQTDDCDVWRAKIAKQIDVNTHRLANSGGWIHISIANEISHCNRTIHLRTKTDCSLVLFHTLLNCQQTVEKCQSPKLSNL